MKTDHGLDVMMECVDDIQSILESDYVKRCNEEGRNVDVLGLLAGDTREYVYRVLSSATEKPIETIKEQELTETFADVTSCLNGEFFSFFTLFQRMAMTMSRPR